MADEIIKFIKTKSYNMINENLGGGAFGKTVLLKDNSLEELFVCKKYTPVDGVPTKQFYDMFKQEIKIMYKLNHQNIVRIYNYYLYDDATTGYILMEYIDGVTIDQYLSRADLVFLDANEEDIFIQLLQAFACLEKNNIVHRDIRSSNIMVDKNGIVKIIDFGLGKDFSKSAFSNDSLNQIINRYGMERIPQEMNEGKYTSKTDMFCIAELYNRLLKNNYIPFFKYQNILNKMMENDPKKRYDSFQQILDKISLQEFSTLDVTEEDKKIYLNFTSSVMTCLNHHSSELKIIENTTDIIDGLSRILEDNCFENFIVDNSSLISIFVKNAYNYNKKSRIEVIVVKQFYEWFIAKNESYQNIIAKNIKIKLSKAKIVLPLELPF